MNPKPTSLATSDTHTHAHQKNESGQEDSLYFEIMIDNVIISSSSECSPYPSCSGLATPLHAHRVAEVDVSASSKEQDYQDSGALGHGVKGHLKVSKVPSFWPGILLGHQPRNVPIRSELWVSLPGTK